MLGGMTRRDGGGDERGEAGDPVGELVDDPVEGRGLPGLYGVGDRPVHTVVASLRRLGSEFLVCVVAHRDHEVFSASTSSRCRGGAATSDRCRRRATATAPGCISGAGCVPAEVAGTGLVSFHSDAANCERAEFCVHTNTTRPARSPAATGCSSSERSRISVT